MTPNSKSSNSINVNDNINVVIFDRLSNFHKIEKLRDLEKILKIQKKNKKTTIKANISFHIISLRKCFFPKN